MIGRPTVYDRFGCVPNRSLWRWVARTFGQILAYPAHRHARPAGGGTDVDDARVQGVLPRVIGLPAECPLVS
jgi:hypothetical protein